ncbi:hypothetical protein B0T22DRAFT_33478 [Podospora appendiculata]|uniref:FAD/NAD(P)-binding domain-containing protein n=1 Tax=Podospora appendiculata TaxID=314037 RepID=A0AAE0XGW8_9PEZI|nr:hypothetical protein B0T22DRAFT_33478 [Podospora appendiculata]
MSSKLVIIGAGFAGVWSALAAKRLINLKGKDKDSKNIEVIVIAPEPSLVLRPRLYEANASSMFHPVGHLFQDAGITFIQGTAEAIDTDGQTVDVQSPSGNRLSVTYDRLILAAGSTVVHPPAVSRLQNYAFDIDSLASATKLESHLRTLLTTLPSSPARDTIVVCGAGFTGIELAAELPGRFPNTRIVVVDIADEIGPELGAGPRPVIAKALEGLGVEVKLGSAVTSIDTEGVCLASGERIESKTVIWTAGVRATSLTRHITGPKDSLSRLHVDQDLRVPSTRHVFATGDAARALTDTKGHYTLMSCQHAIELGRVSGHNAAADLLNEPTVPYSQPTYVCCLDLGAAGAVIGKGWDRKVLLTGGLAKRVKTYINQKLIYPPLDADKAIAAADPVTRTWVGYLIGFVWALL